MKPRFPFELAFWITALLFLFFTKVNLQNHFSFCVLSWFDFAWCPGCGLGRSIHFFLQGDFASSFKLHWFGIPAFFILIYRIIQLFRNFLLTLSINI